MDNIYIKILIALGIVGIFVFGCEKRIEKINYVGTAFHIYKQANYSEVITGIDFEGELYCETDYWEDQISDTWSVFSENGVLTTYNCPKENIKGLKCSSPPINTEYSRTNLNNITNESSFKYYAVLFNGNNVIINKETHISFLKGKSECVVNYFYNYPLRVRIKKIQL